MRVLHIIPSAFEYFDDIKKTVFELVEKLNKRGVENEVITLQYQTPSKKERQAGLTEKVTRKYQGTVDFVAALQGAKDFDVVHLHCPFLGAADKIEEWKKNNPQIPFLVTYYRDVYWQDLISVYIRWYNYRHLPKIFALADAVACLSVEDFSRTSGLKYLVDKNKLAPLTAAADGVKLWNNEKNIDNLINLYDYLIHS